MLSVKGLVGILLRMSLQVSHTHMPHSVPLDSKRPTQPIQQGHRYGLILAVPGARMMDTCS